MKIKNNWTKQEVENIYNKPFMDLMFEAASVHRAYHNPNKVQISSLISIKTGGCEEDCAYCPQAARYHTNVSADDLMSKEEVISRAKSAKEKGSSRVCLGAAWRNVKDNEQFNQVLEMVEEVNAMDMEVCCTLGMLSKDQARRLGDAGLFAYNHNIDTSEEYYKEIISTRSFSDRLKTLDHVRGAGIHVCSGGIIGMGETHEDRMHMLHTLSNMSSHPGSVPINALVPVEGTPLENQLPLDVFVLIRMVATARILMPKSEVRLSAGRTKMTKETQAFCFLAGANSIFAGEKLLTTPNPGFSEDMQLFSQLGIEPTEAFEYGEQPQTKTSYKDNTKKEPYKWERPGHYIERNIQATEKGKIARRELKKQG